MSAAPAPPRISVVIPTYNRGPLLVRALESVLAQDMADFEVLVVDDGSTDDSEQRVAALGDHRVRFVTGDHRGAPAARNRGIELARADVLTFLDSDDEASPGWLSTIVEPFVEPDIGIVCVGHVTLDAQGRQKEVRLPRPGGVLYDDQIVNFMPGTFAVRRRILIGVGGYRDQTARQQQELGRRITRSALDNGFRVVGIPTALIRWHDHGGPRISTDPQAWYTGTLATIEHDGPSIRAASRREYARLQRSAATAATKLGRHRDAAEHLVAAVRADPRDWRAAARLGQATARTAAGARPVRVATRTARSALARALPAPRSDRPVWVFGGSSGREYCDNSRALFEHVRAHRPDVEAVWQIDASSPDVHRIPAGARWVDLTSLEAHRLTRSADVVVFSHGVQDVAGLYGNRHGAVVRLGHGLTAFSKTRGATPVSLRRMVDRVSIAPVASEFERAHKREWGFTDEQLPLTGLPRWDDLRSLAATADERRTVLYAPTWRPWLTPDDFAGSDYWRNVGALAGDPGLRDLLAGAGLHLAVFAHPAVRTMLVDHLGSNSDLELVEHGADVPEVLARSALFITDYSSICFDALTIRVPTAFFQFDRDRHVRDRGSYVDPSERLFGPAARDVGELVAGTKQFIDAGCAFTDYDDDVARWAGIAFAHEDRSNCARVLEAIERGRTA